MARALTFRLEDAVIETTIEKVDRKKLYGWVEKKPQDPAGDDCLMGSLSADGLHLFGADAFEQGYLNADGEWLERNQLVVTNADGAILEKIPSTHQQPIDLSTTVSIDTYLLHNAKSVYQLRDAQALLLAVQQTDGVFTFAYNYTASYTSNPAFLLANDSALFMVVGEPLEFDFIGLREIESPVLDQEDRDADDDLDFSML